SDPKIGNGCFGFPIDRIGSVSGLGCNRLVQNPPKPISGES
uniref:Natriuretic peptide TNPd n=3 Tax=Hydrophiinae TaxID=292440 RepID=VNPD_OXYMI